MSKNVTIINVESMQPTYTNLGLGPIPAGTTADAAVAQVEQVLFKNMVAGWPTTNPAYNSSQQDSGIMGPWTSNVAGTAPLCLTQQIALDFSNWEIPVDSTAINSMAEEITQQISDNGGLSGNFYGRTRIGGAETIYWCVGFGTGAIADQPEEMGIIYVFQAVFGVN